MVPPERRRFTTRGTTLPASPNATWSRSIHLSSLEGRADGSFLEEYGARSCVCIEWPGKFVRSPLNGDFSEDTTTMFSPKRRFRWTRDIHNFYVLHFNDTLRRRKFDVSRKKFSINYFLDRVLLPQVRGISVQKKKTAALGRHLIFRLSRSTWDNLGSISASNFVENHGAIHLSSPRLRLKRGRYSAANKGNRVNTVRQRAHKSRAA